MAKKGALGIPAPVWGAAIVAVLAWAASERLKNPSCKKCGEAVKLVQIGAKYACPACGDVATAAEIVFGLA